MSRKVFISVLGASFYGKCKYVDHNIGFKSSETRFVQQAILERIVTKDWSDTDTALILLTEKAKKDNWNEIISERENMITHEKEEYIGLQKIIKDMGLRFLSTEVAIPDGKNEDEMWTIFQTLFDHLKNKDELYFDLTHSFRYLPMLVLVLTNYAKFLKHVNIKYISYGNYEARNRETNEAPIVDLLPLSLLQDWTFAAGQYLDSGNVDKLITLSKQSLSGVVPSEVSSMENFIDKLETVVSERLTCRGINIIESINFKELKNVSDKLNNTVIKPLNPVLDKIKESFKTFDENVNVKNGYASAYWCFQNHLYQQSITILEESMYTDVCINNGLEWKIRKNRDTVSSSFNIVLKKIPESGWQLREKKDKKEEKMILLRKITESEILKKRIELFAKVYDLRNDINHAGMRDNAKNRSEFIKELTVIFEDVKQNLLC